MAHTPGPWLYQEKSDRYTHIIRVGETAHFICQLAQDTSGIAEANARLIAAAPDMLAALKECAEYMGEPMQPTPGNLQAAVVNALIRNIRAAINIAEPDA